MPGRLKPSASNPVLLAALLPATRGGAATARRSPRPRTSCDVLRHRRPSTADGRRRRTSRGAWLSRARPRPRWSRREPPARAPPTGRSPGRRTGRQIEGYASACSVNRGRDRSSSVRATRTAAALTVLEVFRLGWYGRRLGARRMARPGWNLRGVAQPMPEMDVADRPGRLRLGEQPVRLRTCDEATGRPALVQRRVPGAADRPAALAAQSYVIFVVRDDTPPAGDSAGATAVHHLPGLQQLGRQVALSTGAAANGERASAGVVQPTVRQPMLQNPAAGQRPGRRRVHHQPASRTPTAYGARQRRLGHQHCCAGWSAKATTWPTPPAWTPTCAPRTTAAPGPKAGCRSATTNTGARAMREQVEAARDAGVHLGFFTANAAYWQVRLEAQRGQSASAEPPAWCAAKRRKPRPAG